MEYQVCPVGSKVVMIEALTSDWIYYLFATCNDKKQTMLGPWGSKQNNLRSDQVSCPTGCNGWSITYGSFIGRIQFAGSSNSQALGNGKSFGAGYGDVNKTLLWNESIIGFQIYSDLLGIRAMSIMYAEFHLKNKCLDYNGQRTDECATVADRLGVLWGFMTLHSKMQTEEEI